MAFNILKYSANAQNNTFNTFKSISFLLGILKTLVMNTNKVHFNITNHMISPYTGIYLKYGKY